MKEDATHYDGDYYCEDCAPARETCAKCDDEYDPSEFSSREIANRQARHVDDCCESCADRFTYCTTCGEFVARNTEAEEQETEMHMDGIRETPPPAEPSYRAHCAECDRDIPCPDTLSLEFEDRALDTLLHWIDLGYADHAYEQTLFLVRSRRTYAGMTFTTEPVAEVPNAATA